MLGAAIAAPALPAISQSPAGIFLLENETIVLGEPLDLIGLKDFVIRNCTLIRGDEFDDRGYSGALIVVGAGDGFLIENVKFINGGFSMEALPDIGPCTP